jgi:threonylcarbamoyladenosine tRNA methylthiotransferase MtaB
VLQRPLAALITLGCKLNLADSEEIARELRLAGFAVVDRLCEADAYVLNTCSVTHVADARSRRLVRAARRLSVVAPVVVTGCFPRSAGSDAVRDLGADMVFGSDEGGRARLIEFLRNKVSVERPRVGLEAVPTRRTRAFIRAQEGCNDVCAFCIVPRTRGHERSRPAAAVVAEVEAARGVGIREVVITGTQLGAWGKDIDPVAGPRDLIAAVLAGSDVSRVRFSSLQPRDAIPGLLALWEDPRLVPHFHLALQSGSDAVLSAMRRRYTAGEFLDALGRIRAAVPEAAITTDVIVGFPGETESDFEATLAFCREAGFARVHCFPYSRRNHTSAALMRDQVPDAVRKDRMGRLLQLADQLSLAFRMSFAGSVRPVLWEHARRTPEGLLGFGHTDNYIPVYSQAVREPNRLTATELGQVYHDGVWGIAPGGEE